MSALAYRLVAVAALVLGLSGGATDTWSGATVDETTVVSADLMCTMRRLD